MRKSIRSAAAALAACAGAIMWSAGASAQTLLDGLLPQEGQGAAGVCTCTTIEPPNDCANGLQISQARQTATNARGELRAQCARDWTARCEEQLDWQTCATAEYQAQKNQACDQATEQWWREVVQPQLNQLSAQCTAANDAFVEACMTEVRPEQCVSCDSMQAEIAAVQSQVDEARDWIEMMRSGEVLLTPADEVLIGQRADELDRLRRSLSEKQQAYAVLQDTEFCPPA
ncbi:MAG: hypothetical protein PVI23_14970 [Maricaulaceae bacterium]